MTRSKIDGFSGLVVLVLAGTQAMAQPLVTRESGIFAVVPQSIEIRSLDDIRVITAEIGPLRDVSEATSKRPANVSFFTVYEGNALIGVRAVPTRAYLPVPTAVVLTEDGTYVVEHEAVAYPAEPVDKLAEPKQLTSYTSVEIRYETAEVKAVPGIENGLSWTLTLSPQTGFPPDGQQDNVDAILARVKARFETALADNPGIVRIELLADTAGVMSTTRFLATYSYTQTIQNLYNYADGSKPPQELAFYDNMPAGSLPIFTIDGSQQSATTVIVPRAMAQRWGAAVSPNNPDARISINISQSLPWDYTPLDGITPGRHDFEYALTHEVVHALGFSSMLDQEEGNELPTKVELLDLFRFRTQDISGGTLTITDVSTERRCLQPNIAASLGMNQNTTAGVAVMSTGRAVLGDFPDGDGYQAGHWKAAQLLDSQDQNTVYIGLMDPNNYSNFPQQFTPVSGYFKSADRRALDVLGWDHDISSPLSLGTPLLTAPTHAATAVSRTPTLDWTSLSGATEYVVNVYQGTAVDDGKRVLSVSAGTNTDYAIPSPLSYGTQYLWFVTAVNSVAFAYSEKRLFTTEPCPGDFNNDGMRNGPDLSVLLGNYGQTVTPYTNGDANGDGQVTGADLSVFLGVFGTPC